MYFKVALYWRLHGRSILEAGSSDEVHSKLFSFCASPLPPYNVPSRAELDSALVFERFHIRCAGFCSPAIEMFPLNFKFSRSRLTPRLEKMHPCYTICAELSAASVHNSARQLRTGSSYSACAASRHSYTINQFATRSKENQ